MPISATEIANLMNVPTEGVGAANQFYAQLNAQKKQHENELAFRKQSQESELLNKMIENNTKGINPHYTWANQTLAEKQKQAAQVIANNKIPYNQRQSMVYELLAPIATGNSQAQLIDHTLKEGMPTLKQAYPNLDLNRYEKDILTKGFYDEKGQPREIPLGDVFSHPEFDLNNPEVAASYVTQSGLEKNLPEHFGKAFGVKPTKIEGKDVDTVFTHPSYYKINTQTLQPEVPSVTIRNNNTDYKLLDEQTSQFIPRNKPEYIAAFNMEANKMASKDPNFKNLDPEDQQRAVDYTLLNKYGNANDVKMTESDRRQKTAYEKQQDALSNYYKAQDLKLKKRKQSLAEKQDAEQDTIYKVKRAALESIKTGNAANIQKAASVLGGNSVINEPTKQSFYQSIGLKKDAKSPVKVIDLYSNKENGAYIPDPNANPDEDKFISAKIVYSPYANKSKVLIENAQRVDTPDPEDNTKKIKVFKPISARWATEDELPMIDTHIQEFVNPRETQTGKENTFLGE
jgi:hypothetical protein